MARPGLEQNRKFLCLRAKLRSRVLSLGVLEAMWQAGYESGLDLLGTAEQVEQICGWSELCDLGVAQPGAAFEALKLAQFIEQDERGDWRIHALLDNAPQYVQRRAERAAKRRQEGREKWQRLANIGSQKSPKVNNDSQKAIFDSTPYTQVTTKTTKGEEPLVVASGHQDSKYNNNPAFVFPCQGKPGTWTLTADRLKRLVEAYPGLNVPHELSRAALYLEDEKLRKTERGMWRFLLTWMTNAVEWGHGRRQGHQDGVVATPPRPSPSESDAALRDRQARRIASLKRQAEALRHAGNVAGADRLEGLARQFDQEASNE